MIRVDTSFLDEDKKKIDWVTGQQFSLCEEIFPSWSGARVVLTKYLNNLMGWQVVIIGRDVRLGLVNERLVHIPENEKYTFLEIWESALTDYLPDMEDFKIMKVVPSLERLILSKIAQREKYIVSLGGLSMKEELKFRLGVSAFKD